MVTEVRYIASGKRGDFYEVHVDFRGEAYIVHVFAAHDGGPVINRDVDDIPDWWEDYPDEVLEEALAAEFATSD